MPKQEAKSKELNETLQKIIQTTNLSDFKNRITSVKDTDTMQSSGPLKSHCDALKNVIQSVQRNINTYLRNRHRKNTYCCKCLKNIATYHSNICMKEFVNKDSMIKYFFGPNEKDFANLFEQAATGIGASKTSLLQDRTVQNNLQIIANNINELAKYAQLAEFAPKVGSTPNN